MSGVKHTRVELHAVFNGLYWDVAVGPHDYSQCVGSCHPNAALGYGVDGAERYAHLFAAAPDLLSVAKLALKTILDEAEARDFDPPADTNLVAELEASITRATGDRPEKGGAL